MAASPEVLAQFQEITQITDEPTATAILDSCSWNLETAVGLVFSGAMGTSESINDANAGLRRRPNPSVPNPSGIANGGGAQPQLHQQSGSGRGNTRRVLEQSQTQQQEGGGFMGRILGLLGLPFSAFSAVLNFFAGFFGTLIPAGRAARLGANNNNTMMGNDDSTGGYFKELFELEFGTNHPTMLEGTFEQALAEAKRDFKFVLLYLHSPEHQDSDEFCRRVLCNDAVIAYIDEHALFWGTSVHTEAGRALEGKLRTGAYPFFGLFLYMESRMTLAAAVQGTMSIPDFLTKIGEAIERLEPQLVVGRTERSERSMTQTIREEQDAAYEESLKADRERAEKLAEEEARKKAKEEEARRKEEEAERALKERAAALKKKRENLPPEPLSRDAAAVVRIKFPSGEFMNRKFSLTNPVEVLYDFVDIQEKVGEDFSLLNGQNRNEIPSSSTTTLEEAVGRKALVLVQDNTV